MDRRILVTGGAGFVGRHVVYQACMRRPMRADADLVVSADRVLPPTYGNHCVAVDLEDEDDLSGVIHALRPTHVVHCAGVTHSPTVDGFLRGNVSATFHLLRALAIVGRRDLVKFVDVSSAAAYGTTDALAGPLREDRPLAPATTYAWSKTMQERVCDRFAREWDLPVVHARLFNVTGPGQRPTMFPAAFFRRLVVEDGPELPVVGWESARDLVDVRDVARALLLLADAGKPGEACNVGTGIASTVGQVAATARAISGVEKVPVPVETALGGDWSWADESRLRALGWAPRHDLEESLSACWGWIRSITPEPTETTSRPGP